MVRILTENLNQSCFSPYSLHKISDLIEQLLGHLCYPLTNVPPQPNFLTHNVFTFPRRSEAAALDRSLIRLVYRNRGIATVGI